MKPKSNVAPSRKDQKIIFNSDRVALFASWIDKKDSSYYNNKKPPYEFKLLHNSSRNGFNAASFHKNCDNKGATIWVAIIQGSTQLIGGYNPRDWSGKGSKDTTNSFLFNFTDVNNIFSAKFGLLNNQSDQWQLAIHCYSNEGPSI
ncbi:hypothetical protein RclHR1_03590012 [Rhizophagus clarus]|nr:hypothetical protein RclHR1_03590012 [Rhizophagus clarus]